VVAEGLFNLPSGLTLQLAPALENFDRGEWEKLFHLKTFSSVDFPACILKKVRRPT